MSKLFIKLVSSILLCWLLGISPVQAADICRQIEGHQVCIVKIERSAKNYWQYKATAKIDGKEKPVASYDCRERSITDLDGNISLFRSRLDSQLVCSLYRR